MSLEISGPGPSRRILTTSPDLAIRWFHATDAPKADATPFRPPSTVASASGTPATAPQSGDQPITRAKQPSHWIPFSARDSAAIEAAWQALQSRERGQQDDPGSEISTRVQVNEDQLYEVDVEKKEIYPVYWYGATYDIRRGTWFMSTDGVKFYPADDNLARQLEDGYQKFKPWRTASETLLVPNVTTHVSSSDAADPLPVPGTLSSASTNSGSNANSNIPTSSTTVPPVTPAQSKSDSKPPPTTKPEQRWALFGPWMNSYVVFTNASTGWLFSDHLSSKWARAFMAGITRNENTGGTRVVRGWSDVERLIKKAPLPQSTAGLKRKVSVGSEDKAAIDQIEKAQEKIEAEDYISTDSDEADQERQINHLVFVIHGIGQKLGERLENVNIVHDCNILRHAIKEAAKNFIVQPGSKEALAKGNKKAVLPIPDLGGVQVLPVQWRHMIDFGKKKTAPVVPSSSNPAKSDQERPTGDDVHKDDADRERSVRPVVMADIDDIQLDGVPSIRMLVSDVALDVLLYMTPKYRQEMVRHVTSELNRIYQTYIQRNPKFNGRVSIYGHSLGSLLAFDILCNQTDEAASSCATPTVEETPGPNEPIGRGASEVDLSEVLNKAIGQGGGGKSRRKVGGLMERTSIRYERLEFQVDKLFAVGSPVGLFLLLKGDKLRARRAGKHVVEPGISSPAVNYIYNIFHPHDPIAYRYEPMVSRSFASRKPVQLPYHKGGLTRTIVGIADISSNIFSGIYSMASGAVGMFGSGPNSSARGSAPNLVGDISPAVIASSFNSVTAASSSTPNVAPSTGGLATSPSRNAGSSAINPSESSSGGNKLKPKASAESIDGSSGQKDKPEAPSQSDEDEIRRLNPSGRIDYVLQEGVLENPYLSSLSSHMTYWPDQDVAVFILKELYADANSSAPSTK